MLSQLNDSLIIDFLLASIDIDSLLNEMTKKCLKTRATASYARRVRMTYVVEESEERAQDAPRAETKSGDEKKAAPGHPDAAFGKEAV